MLQRAVSAGRGARSKADFAPRTVAGGAGAAEGGGCRGRDLSGGVGGFALLARKKLQETWDGAASLQVQGQPLQGPGVSIDFVFLCNGKKTGHCRWARG